MKTIKYWLMSKYNKLMHSLPVWQSNQQRVHLDCGIILNFKNNTIEYDELYKAICDIDN